MLGEQIGEFRGKVTGTRVLPGDDYRYIKVETTIEQQGQLLGQDAGDMGTFTAFERVPGQMYAEGVGMLFAGTEGAIWNGHGIGRMGDTGNISVRFAIALQAGQDGPLARLNECLVIGEYEQDAEGNTHSTLWEWK